MNVVGSYGSRDLLGSQRAHRRHRTWWHLPQAQDSGSRVQDNGEERRGNSQRVTEQMVKMKLGFDPGF